MVQARLDRFTHGSISPTEFEIEDGHVSHPYLKPGMIDHRLFQTRIAENCIGRNSLVVLPTGLGKTIIALLVTIRILQETGGKTLFVAPTRPLVQQHHDTYQTLTTDDLSLGMVSGSIRPEKRMPIYQDWDIVFSTPQTAANDIDNRRLPTGELSLLVVDEAHRAVGDYSYVSICDNVSCPILGLTASPGGKKKKIREVLDNLRVEVIEARTRQDPDVAPYVKTIDVDWIKVELTSEMKELQSLLTGYLEEKIAKLQKVGILTYKKPGEISKTDLLGARKQITSRFHNNKGVMFGSIHNQSVAVYAYHCLETLETQGVSQLRVYLERMSQEEEPSKSKRSFLNDERIQEVMELAGRYSDVSHPKLDALAEIIDRQLAKKVDSRVIVFTQLRDTIPTIMDIVGERTRGVRFVGQATRPDGQGMSQEEQGRILDDFRAKQFNVLVATSVAEEGLDIPDVDMVVFYEPLPSEIRNIQRRGRT
ncbi:MAG: DEAD/DEAH box helicase family protein, partial [Thermoplasmatota archaeon]